MGGAVRPRHAHNVPRVTVSSDRAPASDKSSPLPPCPLRQNRARRCARLASCRPNSTQLLRTHKRPCRGLRYRTFWGSAMCRVAFSSKRENCLIALPRRGVAGSNPVSAPNNAIQRHRRRQVPKPRPRRQITGQPSWRVLALPALPTLCHFHDVAPACAKLISPENCYRTISIDI